MSAAIVIHNLGDVSLSLTPEFTQLKADALAKAHALQPVKDADSQALATEVLSNIKGLLRGIEQTRAQVKAPVLALGKQIDSIAKEATQELVATGIQINEQITAFYRAEAAKAEAARRMQEALDAKRRAREAEALQEAARAKEAEAQAAQAKADAPPAQPPVATAPKAQKMTVRRVWKHEVTDIQALYAARPELCSIEPRTNAILAEIRGGMSECPGLKIWQEDDVTVRS
jgi:hypothetical protein